MSIVWSANFSGVPYQVHQLRMLKDNFAYIIASGNQAVAIDASDGPMLVEVIEKCQYKLDAFLMTHHHEDHIAGAQYAKSKTECQLIGPKHEMLDFVDQDVAEGEECSVGPFCFEVIETPGHSKDHLSYFFRECNALFCGDTIFLSGCGRIFDSTADHFYSSLQKLKALPEKTLIFCGHDYFERNIAFAREKEPENEALKNARHATFRTLEEEIPLNLFLQADTKESFASLRDEKNLFDAQWNS